MGLGGILILLLLLVSLIVFIYVLVVTARGWGVLHSILLSCLFIECWVLMVFSAGVHYRRVNATEQAFKNQQAAEQAQAQTLQLMWGDFGVDPDALEAVVPVQGKLRRMTADRGRVWRQASYLQSDNGAYQLELSTNQAPANAEVDPLAEEPAAAAPVQAPSSESLPVNTVVYAFAEDLNEAGQPIPVFYLGEFVVKESQAGQVKLEPTLDLYAEQQQRIASGAAGRWTLYELLPLDSHDTFAAPGSRPSGEAIFGRMDEETLRNLFANVPADDNRQQQLIDSYLRDGLRASDSDPSEAVWVQVSVLQEYEIDVDSKEVANATERGYFDALGRSIDSRLKVGENGTVKLTPDTKGAIIVLKEEVAAPLISSGVLALIQRVYVRPLIDYEEAFNQHVVRDHEVSETIALYQRDTAEVEKANQLGQEMISFRQVEEQELKSDLANFQKEVEVLNKAAAEAETELADLKTKLRQLYLDIQAQHSARTASGVSSTITGN
jgi:uncharacterized membrane protein